MGFRLVPNSVTLNDLERRHNRYIALFHWIWWTCVPTHGPTGNRVDLWQNLAMHESIVYCSTCTMSSSRKFTFAISSSDEFLVTYTV